MLNDWAVTLVLILIGRMPSLWILWLTLTYLPATEREQAHNHAKAQYLAVTFLVNSDCNCYGNLVHDIENEYTQGSNTYPATLSAVYDYIMNYQPDSKGLQHDPASKSKLLYYMEDNDGSGHGRG